MTKKVDMTEEEYERELAFSFHGGSASAMEEDALILMEEAKTAFGLGRDERAEDFRRVAKVLEDRGKTERLEQAKYQHPDRGKPVVTRGQLR